MDAEAQERPVAHLRELLQHLVLVAAGDRLLEPPTEEQVRSALSAASAVGDDSIQERMQGQVTPHTWTHGSSEQRQRWFTTGYETGDPAQCDTFATDDLG